MVEEDVRVRVGVSPVNRKWRLAEKKASGDTDPESDSEEGMMA